MNPDPTGGPTHDQWDDQKDSSETRPEEQLGLKNIKAITRITYTKDEPPDYWEKRGYSAYDGI